MEMIYLPKIEREIEINAPIKRVYEIINDFPNMPKWNVNANEVIIIEPRKKGIIKAKFGEMTGTVIENIENEKLSLAFEGIPLFNSLGYIFIPKGDITIVKAWVEFEKAEQKQIVSMAGERNLNSLKKYAEYLEAGGNPDEYKKK